MPVLPVLTAGIAVAASIALTGLVRHYARARAILDVPNERSSHSVPTPRGGGLAIAGVILAGIAVLGALGVLPGAVVAAIGGGGSLVAAIGWRDDRRHVPAAVRAGVHLVAAVWAVWCLGGLPAITLGTGRVVPGAAGAVLAVLAIVWCVNLYNFMDGIDGIAGVEAVTVAGALGAVLLAAGRPALGALALLVAGAAGGFLVWNWSPARIFMGDVGSGFLGFVLATLAIAAERVGAVPGVALVVLLLAVFVLDATVTLFRRMARGERWTQAHRSHAYQRAVQSGLTHGRVSLTVLATNLVLACLALRAAAHPDELPTLLALGFVLVLVLYLAVERRRPMYARAGTGVGEGAARAGPG